MRVMIGILFLLALAGLVLFATACAPAIGNGGNDNDIATHGPVRFYIPADAIAGNVVPDTLTVMADEVVTREITGNWVLNEGGTEWPCTLDVPFGLRSLTASYRISGGEPQPDSPMQINVTPSTASIDLSL